MSVSERFHTEEFHPIDVAEHVAANREWECSRVDEDQLHLGVAGQWHTYSVTLAWSDYDEALRLFCTFEMNPPEERLPALYEALNLANDMCWTGTFLYWSEQRTMTFRAVLPMGGEQLAAEDEDRIDRLVTAAVGAAERFYPAFQMVAWGRDRDGASHSPAAAMEAAIAEAYGRA